MASGIWKPDDGDMVWLWGPACGDLGMSCWLLPGGCSRGFGLQQWGGTRKEQVCFEMVNNCQVSRSFSWLPLSSWGPPARGCENRGSYTCSALMGLRSACFTRWLVTDSFHRLLLPQCPACLTQHLVGLDNAPQPLQRALPPNLPASPTSLFLTSVSFLLEHLLETKN